FEQSTTSSTCCPSPVKRSEISLSLHFTLLKPLPCPSDPRSCGRQSTNARILYVRTPNRIERKRRKTAPVSGRLGRWKRCVESAGACLCTRARGLGQHVGR